MRLEILKLGLGAGIVAFVASVCGEVYREECIVGQRAVGWVILLLAVVGVVSFIIFALELQDRLDRYERALRHAGIDTD